MPFVIYKNDENRENAIELVKKSEEMRLNRGSVRKMRIYNVKKYTRFYAK